MTKTSEFFRLLLAGLGFSLVGCILAGCAGNSKSPYPKAPSLLSVSPDAKVYPIGTLFLKSSKEPFGTYPRDAWDSSKRQPPKEGCVMVEVLIDGEGSVQRASIAEQYPKNIFSQDVLKHVKFNKYVSNGADAITYHFYRFSVDRYGNDSGLLSITHGSNSTELILDLDIEKRYNVHKPEKISFPDGTSVTGVRTIRVREEAMPRQCKSLYDRYKVLVQPV